MNSPELKGQKSLFEGSVLEFLNGDQIYEVDLDGEKYQLRKTEDGYLVTFRGETFAFNAKFKSELHSGEKVRSDTVRKIIEKTIRQQFSLTALRELPSNMVSNVKSGNTTVSVTKKTNCSTFLAPSREYGRPRRQVYREENEYAVIIGLEKESEEGIAVIIDDSFSVKDISIQKNVDGKMLVYSPRDLEALDLLPVIYSVLSAIDVSTLKTEVLPGSPQPIARIKLKTIRAHRRIMETE